MVSLELISVPLVISVLFPNLLGVLSGASASKNVDSWYRSLKKPSLNPPEWVFAVVWPILYSAIGFASFVVWTEGGFRAHAGAFVLYAAQLGLNAAWAPAFFKAHNFTLASLLNTAMIVEAAVTAWSFYKVKPLAGWLFVPYIAWLAFANYINGAITKLNPQGGGGSSSGGSQGTPSSEQVPNSPWKETATEPLYNTEGRENPGEQGYGDLRGRASAMQASPIIARPNRQMTGGILTRHNNLKCSHPHLRIVPKAAGASRCVCPAAAAKPRYMRQAFM